MNDESIGVIGMGIIGFRVAQVLRDTDRQVYVWNRSPRAVPNFLPSPSAIAEHAKIIQIFVTDGSAVLSVVDAMLETLSSDHIVINCSTIAPEDNLKAAYRVEAAGAAFLDAPFTGSKEAAEAGELVYYAGGDAATIRKATPVLEISGKAVVPIGDIGDATAVKIATSMIAATATQGLAEALGLCIAMDVQPEKLAMALDHHGVSSPLTRLKFPQMIAGDFEPRFSLANMVKDTGIALDLAKSFDISFPTVQATADTLGGFAKEGKGDQDFSIVASKYFKG
jgi:3-hydroxyisobutyrate dehydrogenase-like beta-hydroxyacid dehydrogenase